MGGILNSLLRDELSLLRLEAISGLSAKLSLLKPGR